MSSAQFVGVPEPVMQKIRSRISRVKQQGSAEDVIHYTHDVLVDLETLSYTGVLSPLQAKFMRAHALELAAIAINRGDLDMEMTR